MAREDAMLVLSPDCSLKLLEAPHLYNRAKDVLYELDEEAFHFLRDNQVITGDVGPSARELVEYCYAEGILLSSSTPAPIREFALAPQKPALTASLRYLLLHLTKRCNLNCKHCYIAPIGKLSLGFEDVVETFRQMEKMQGLIVLLSGGELLLHPDFWRINAVLPEFDLRFEVLSNGTLITPKVARRLNVHHIQVSIDGMEQNHDFMRGKGSFQKALAGIRNLIDAGKETSISSMVFANNLQDFDAMATLWKDLGIRQWIVNAPSLAGNWIGFPDLAVSPQVAAKFMIKYSNSEGPHKSAFDLTCGTHICTVMADGDIYPCPLLTAPELRMGSIRKEGLRVAWSRKVKLLPALLEPVACEFGDECRRGCRFRAQEYGSPSGCDPVLHTILQHRSSGKEVIA